MNVEMFEKVIKYLEDEPRRFDMHEGIRSIRFGDFAPRSNMLLRSAERPEEEMPPCGTVCCIAGAAAILSGKLQPTIVDGKKLYDVGWWPVEAIAQEALGIDDEQAHRLFYIPEIHPAYKDGWPKEDRDAYLAAKTSEERTKAGIARMLRFLATNGAE